MATTCRRAGAAAPGVWVVVVVLTVPAGDGAAPVAVAELTAVLGAVVVVVEVDDDVTVDPAAGRCCAPGDGLTAGVRRRAGQRRCAALRQRTAAGAEQRCFAAA